MSLLAWNEQMSIGLATFDDEHKKLVGMLVALGDAMRVGKGREVVGVILGELVQYTVTHFAHEERLFKLYGYPNYEKHKALHGALTKSVQGYQQRYEAGLINVVELFSFLADWLKRHIQNEDRQYVPFLAAKGIR